MRKFFHLLIRSAVILAVMDTHAQDYSNKGKDFWVIYTGHIDGTTSRMALYITSDQDATGTVSVAGNTINFTVIAHQLKAPLIPNIFSPNGDGIHDTWMTGYLESYPGCTIDIFNRYGQLIFHSVGFSTGWDGKVNGNDVPGWDLLLYC